MNYPKVWGDRQNAEARIVAEARERGLQGVAAPYLTASGPGFRADKKGAFSEVTIDGAGPADTPARSDAGFIFRRLDDDTFWGLPNKTDGSPGTVGGPMSWSKLSTQARVAGATRKYKLIPRADNTYGSASWHGAHPDHVLSWSAQTIRYSGVSPTQTQHRSASPVSGKSGLCSVGSGSRVFWKGQVALDLTDPRLVAPPSLIDLASCLVGGAAMDRRNLYVAVTRGLFGDTGASPTSASLHAGNYSVYFVQIPYRIVERDGARKFVAGKKITQLGVYNWFWFSQNRPAILAKAEDLYGLQGSAPDGPYRTIPAYYNVPIPISDWAYDVTGRRARCVFFDSEFWVDLVTANYVMTFDADAAAADRISVDPRLLLFSSTTGRWENGEGQRLPGGGEVFDNNFMSTTTVYWPSGYYNNGFESGSSTNWRLLPGEPRVPLAIQARYDGVVPVTAELQVSDYVISGSSTWSVRRPDTSSPFVIAGESSWTQRFVTDLIFYRDGVEASRCTWATRNSTGIITRAGGATAFAGQNNSSTHPLAVLFLDAGSQTAVWIELWREPVYLASYDTPDVAVQHPTFPVEYVPYTLNPTTIETRLYLRRFVRGVEDTPILLREASYPLIDPPVVARATVFGPSTSTSSPVVTQGFWTGAQGKGFYTTFGGWRSSIDYNCPTYAASSEHGSGATFFDAVMWSARPHRVDLDAAVLAAAKLDEYEPIELGPPVVTEHPAFSSFLTNGDPRALAGIGAYEKAWFQNISIY